MTEKRDLMIAGVRAMREDSPSKIWVYLKDETMHVATNFVENPDRGYVVKQGDVVEIEIDIKRGALTVHIYRRTPETQ